MCLHVANEEKLFSAERSESREKGKDLTRSYDKSPTPTEKSRKQSDNTKTAPKLRLPNDGDRLGAVTWSNGSYPTNVVKSVYGIQTFLLTAKLCYQKDKHLKFVNNPPYKDR